MPPKDVEAYAYSTQPAEPYEGGPDSQRHPGCPSGSLRPTPVTSTTVFPGRSYSCTLYVPEQYDDSQPANLVVFLDGSVYLAPPFNTAIVLDNLIAKGDIPLTLALFVDAGTPGPGLPIYGGDDNRSLEYDSITEDYSRFLLEEALPLIEAEYNISQDPSARGVCGISSGGNCAFTVAWHRPDRFGRVISHIGSFVDIRGGDRHASLVRKNDRKALRVFLQTGKRDLNTVFGNWRMGNEALASALAYRDYEHQLIVGEGGHTPTHGASILPDTLRWLWAR